jgi:hypothetical protein
MRFLVMLLVATGLLAAASLAPMFSASAQSSTSILDFFDDGP